MGGCVETDCLLCAAAACEFGSADGRLNVLRLHPTSCIHIVESMLAVIGHGLSPTPSSVMFIKYKRQRRPLERQWLV